MGFSPHATFSRIGEGDVHSGVFAALVTAPVFKTGIDLAKPAENAGNSQSLEKSGPEMDRFHGKDGRLLAVIGKWDSLPEAVRETIALLVKSAGS